MLSLETWICCELHLRAPILFKKWLCLLCCRGRYCNWPTYIMNSEFNNCSQLWIFWARVIIKGGQEEMLFACLLLRALKGTVKPNIAEGTSRHNYLLFSNIKGDALCRAWCSVEVFFGVVRNTQSILVLCICDTLLRACGNTAVVKCLCACFALAL